MGKNGFQDIGHQAMKNHYLCKIENKWDELFYCPSQPPGGFPDKVVAKGNPGGVQPSLQINVTGVRVPEKTRLGFTEHRCGGERVHETEVWRSSKGLLQSQLSPEQHTHNVRKPPAECHH